MRICFISHTAGRDGAERSLLELLQGLSKLGVQCLVFVPRKGPLLVELDRLNIPWRVLGYPWWWKPLRKSIPYRVFRTLKGWVAAARLARMLVEWRCDLVYTNTVSVSTGAFAARLARKPHVWHLHESGYRDPRLKFDLGQPWSVRLIDRLSAQIIVVSLAVAGDYSRYLKPERMRVVYQSVTLPDKIEEAYDLNQDKKSFQCVMVGSLQSRKGQDEAVSALAEVVRRGIDASLVLVGGGEENFRAELDRQVKDYGLEQRVNFTGYKCNVIQFLDMADVVLVCSRWESFGRVTAEAMLAGKTVIGSASGGTSELIQDGITGLLYERGNYVELADKIQYLYENPGVKLRLGQEALKWAAERFTQERYAKEMFTVLREVLAKAKMPR